MKHFEKFALDAQVQTPTEEKVYTPPVNSYAPVDTNIYQGKITQAYMVSVKNSKATGLKLSIRLDTGQFLNETFYLTSKDTGETTYVKENQKFPMPGYATLEDLTNLSLGKALLDLDFETIELPDTTWQAAEGSTMKVESAKELVGQEVKLSVKKELRFKSLPDPNGQWHPTTETKEYNNIDKFFDITTGKTALEMRTNAAPEYGPKFIEQNKGKVFDATKGKATNAQNTQAASDAVKDNLPF